MYIDNLGASGAVTTNYGSALPMGMEAIILNSNLNFYWLIQLDQRNWRLLKWKYEARPIAR
jgi:hypothetical protein